MITAPFKRSYWHILAALICLHFYCYGDSDFNLEDEKPFLSGIEQVTFEEMGFEKCGEGYFSPDGKKIIFQAVPKNKEHYQIFVMDLQQKKPFMVSTGKGACTCAYFRPDGEKIIFASSHEDPYINDESSLEVPGYKRSTGNYFWEFTPYMNIYEASVDGSDLTALTRGPSYSAECAYSSDGTKIVFASNRSGSMNLYTMDSTGRNVYQVTHDNSCYNGGPFFSPGGDQIIFRADRQEKHYLQIYSIDVNGENERQLTNNGAVNWAPYWHPSGEAIAFTTSLHGHAHYEIYMLDIQQNIFVRITHNPSFDGLPVFSNDGKKMLWTSKRGNDQSCQLFIADFALPQIISSNLYF